MLEKLLHFQSEEIDGHTEVSLGPPIGVVVL